MFRSGGSNWLQDGFSLVYNCVLNGLANIFVHNKIDDFVGHRSRSAAQHPPPVNVRIAGAAGNGSSEVDGGGGGGGKSCMGGDMERQHSKRASPGEALI